MVFSTSKTHHHDITEIMLKVALDIINLALTLGTYQQKLYILSYSEGQISISIFICQKNYITNIIKKKYKAKIQTEKYNSNYLLINYIMNRIFKKITNKKVL